MFLSFLNISWPGVEALCHGVDILHKVKQGSKICRGMGMATLPDAIGDVVGDPKKGVDLFCCLVCEVRALGV